MHKSHWAAPSGSDIIGWCRSPESTSWWSLSSVRDLNKAIACQSYALWTRLICALCVSYCISTTLSHPVMSMTHVERE